MTLDSHPVPLVRVTRGFITESEHLGSIVIADAQGMKFASLGDPEARTFLRSSAKPLQALPLVEHAGLEALNLSDRHLAIIAGSHSGEYIHVQAVSEILHSVGCTLAQLTCGVHRPYDRAATEQLRLSGQMADARHHNCSGKHAGMLALASVLGVSSEDYANPDHPVQVEIRHGVAEMLGLSERELRATVAPDGCGAPAYAAPLTAMARAFACLIDPPDTLRHQRSAACLRIAGAMRDHPEMVAGRNDRSDTMIMRASPALVVKAGAEGVICVGIPRGAIPDVDRGLGLALKISDGDVPGRARTIALVQALRAIGAISVDAIEQLQPIRSGVVTTVRGAEVGQIEPCFDFGLYQLQ